MADLRTAAIIPAAGLSSRMKTFKPLMHLGDRTLVEHAIALFEAVGVDDIVTVVGYRANELVPVVRRTSSRCVVNRDYSNGMFSSIRQGAQNLNSCDAFFLLPVDTPLVRVSTVIQLIEAFKGQASTLICYPLFNSMRGHPPLIDCALISKIAAYDGPDGMRGFLRKFEHRASSVSVADPCIRMDVDTPGDFKLLENLYLNTEQFPDLR